MHEPGRRGRRQDRRHRRDAPRLRLEGSDHPPRHGQGARLTAAGTASSTVPSTQRARERSEVDRAAGVVREGLLQGPRRVRHGHPEGDHPRLPQARPGEPPRRQARRHGGGGAVQGDLGGLRRGRRRREAQGVRRGPHARPDGRLRRADGWRRARRRLRARRVHASPPRTSPVAAASATSSATCSAAVATPARRAAPAPSGAPTSRPSCTMDFEDAVRGITTTLHLTSEATCHVCTGSGAEPGHRADRLPDLRRSRRHRRQPGHVLAVAALPAVRGPGHDRRGPVPQLPRQRRRAPAP